MKQFIFIYVFFFSSYLISQEYFNGSWESDDSNYYLTINGENFSTYRFVPNKSFNKELKWDKVYSPGKEKFIKKEDNIIVTNYWIEEQQYYVKVTYTLIDEQNIKAEFNGKLKGEFYYNVINYKKVKFTKPQAVPPL